MLFWTSIPFCLVLYFQWAVPSGQFVGPFLLCASVCVCVSGGRSSVAASAPHLMLCVSIMEWKSVVLLLSVLYLTEITSYQLCTLPIFFAFLLFLYLFCVVSTKTREKLASVCTLFCEVHYLCATWFQKKKGGPDSGRKKGGWAACSFATEWLNFGFYSLTHFIFLFFYPVYLTDYLEDASVCSSSKRTIKMNSRSSALLIQLSKYPHVSEYAIDCHLEIEAPKNQGLQVIVEDINLRRNSYDGECDDYVWVSSLQLFSHPLL